MPLTPDRVLLPSGVSIEYVAAGDPDGTAVVLIHGWSDSWRSWEGVLHHLPDSVRAYAISLRGHGDSDRPAIGYDVTTFAADVDGFMSAVGLPSAAIVGHSMGTMVAARYAIDVPSRVDSLVLAGAKRTFATDQALAPVYVAVDAMSDPVDPAFVHDFQASTVVRPVADGLIDTAVHESLKLPARVWRASMYGTLHTDFSDDFDRIEAPTLLIAGEYDEMGTPAAQQELLGAIRNARLTTYAGAGHAIHWESPERFASDLAVFVQNAVPGRLAA